jgi:hypothetical protein
VLSKHCTNIWLTCIRNIPKSKKIKNLQKCYPLSFFIVFYQSFFFLFSAPFRFFLLSVLLSFLLLSNWFLFLSSFVFPLLFRHCFIPISLAHVVSSLAYPNWLGTKRLGCCCCCCCYPLSKTWKRLEI